MLDINGRTIQVGDFVATTRYGSQIRTSLVVGFTPQKVKLEDGIGSTNHYLKFSNEVAVLDNSDNHLTERRLAVLDRIVERLRNQ